jgi:hypothetical protein
VSEIATTPDKAASLDTLCRYLAKDPLPELPTRHQFHGGTYYRTVWLDKGVVAVGRTHKRDHMLIVLSGSIAILNGPNDDAAIYCAPATIESGPGTRRAAVALEPSLVMTVHRTDATTPEDAETELVERDQWSIYDARNRRLDAEIAADSRKEIEI